MYSDKVILFCIFVRCNGNVILDAYVISKQHLSFVRFIKSNKKVVMYMYIYNKKVYVSSILNNKMVYFQKKIILLFYVDT